MKMTSCRSSVFARPLILVVILVAAASVALVAGEAAAQSTTRVASGLASPTYATHPPGDFDRLFVTERFGDIEILDLNTGTLNGTPFLSILAASDEGLQGLAFHPDYQSNGFFYVYYNVSGQTQVVRYSVSTDPDIADAGSATTVIEIAQPAGNHNGGWIGFGPDGLLYVPLGDGGDFPADTLRNYAIPASNPFVGITGDDEIWAYGLRNPFRSSFDRVTGAVVKT